MAEITAEIQASAAVNAEIDCFPIRYVDCEDFEDTVADAVTDYLDENPPAGVDRYNKTEIDAKLDGKLDTTDYIYSDDGKKLDVNSLAATGQIYAQGKITSGNDVLAGTTSLTETAEALAGKLDKTDDIYESSNGKTLNADKLAANQIMAATKFVTTAGDYEIGLNGEISLKKTTTSVSELKSDLVNLEEVLNVTDSNLLNTVNVLLDTYVNKSGVESTNDAFCTYKMIDVSNYLGQKLYCHGTGISTVLRAVSFYKADGSYISGFENITSGNYIVPPIFAKYVTVSVPYYNRTAKTVPTDLYLSNNSDGKYNYALVVTDKIRNDVKNVTEIRNLVCGQQIIPRYYINGNNCGDSNTFYTIKDIPVKYGAKYYIHCDGSSRGFTDARFITEYDISNSVVNTIQQVSKSYTPTSNSVVKVAITFFYLEDYPTSNTGLYYFSQYPLTENTRLVNDIDRTFMKSISDLEVFYEETRKATICFSFDDGVAQDSQIVNAFDEYGAKCGFALISSILNDTRIADYRELYNRGYSILCHSNNGDNMGNETSLSESVLLEKMRDTRVAFEKFGIKISGWVTPSSFMKSDYIPTLEKFYNYGYTRYFGDFTDTTKTPYDELSNSGYYLKRVHIGTTSIENLKLAVDNAITNNGLLSFYGHAYELDDNTLDMSKLKELLAYIKTKEHDLMCHLYAPDEAMIYYFRPRHND